MVHLKGINTLNCIVGENIGLLKSQRMDVEQQKYGMTFKNRYLRIRPSRLAVVYTNVYLYSQNAVHNLQISSSLVKSFTSARYWLF